MIYKLKYNSEQEATSDLILKGIIDEENKFQQGVHAVVWIGTIVITQGTYDDYGKELTAPINAEGYHVDIMCEQEVDFGNNETFPNNPKHSFAE